MFDKVVTPSDVGKLNRLVIPKQHAERYFPLDTATHKKGLLLSFEDRKGKPWRFRYSYWNSSQSYVMTKGWSRFVKEKRLDAGDTVSFGRGVDDKDRLFIDWKRRPEIHDPLRGQHLPRIPLPLPPSDYHHGHHHHPMVSLARSVGPWAGRILLPPASTVYDGHHRQNYVHDAAAGGGTAGEYHVFRSAVAQQPQAAVQLGISGFGSGGGGDQDGTVLGAAAAAPMVLESVPVVQTQAAAGKRMRLFGVNLDLADSDGDPGESSIRSQASGTSSSSSPPLLDLDM